MTHPKNCPKCSGTGNMSLLGFSFVRCNEAQASDAPAFVDDGREIPLGPPVLCALNGEGANISIEAASKPVGEVGAFISGRLSAMGDVDMMAPMSVRLAQRDTMLALQAQAWSEMTPVCRELLAQFEAGKESEAHNRFRQMATEHESRMKDAAESGTFIETARQTPEAAPIEMGFELAELAGQRRVNDALTAKSAAYFVENGGEGELETTAKDALRHLVTQMGFDLDDLANSDIDEDRDTNYSSGTIKIGGQEFLYGSKYICDELASDRVWDAVWTFNDAFIACFCPNYIGANIVKRVRGADCEDANGPLQGLIMARCAKESFIERVLKENGRGPQLSPFDSVEHEAHSDCFLYRLD